MNGQVLNSSVAIGHVERRSDALAAAVAEHWLYGLSDAYLI